MNACKYCPTLSAMTEGMDPESLDLISDPEYCEDPSYCPTLYCPWTDRDCPTHTRLLAMAKRLHRAGKPLPWRLHERFKKKGF